MLEEGVVRTAKRKKNTENIPDYRTATEFLRGQASKIFDEVNESDKVIIVNKNSKPYSVIISYYRYRRLKDDGADI